MTVESYEWASEHGDQWLAQLSSWEKMLKPADGPILEWLAKEFAAKRQNKSIRVADIACGGGGTTLAIEEILPENGLLHGFDISRSMMLEATKRAESLSSEVKFFEADLQSSGPPDAPYDILLSRFGTMFFTEPNLAFNSLRKWIAPEGKFLFAVWADQSLNPWSMLVAETAARFIELPSIDKTEPGPFRYANVEPLMSALNAAGFRDLDTKTINFRLKLGGGLSAENAANFALEAYEVGELLRSAGNTIFLDAQKELVNCLKHYEEDGLVITDAQMHTVSGAI